ncbi:ParB/RepB/Spo0J family partition protein [Sediminispirochaeta bajacaliforniensis]|uniref:ParB/RepB/Spo0J family partition protein n=1 Tax=Sediminispirochaeta bajacaliforniensis TaxID=148 RepID=UPI000360B129|nr:ParB/RepB/Spo0J family partition protein [Sediminispirochaeta bajacaliforniensis]
MSKKALGRGIEALIHQADDSLELPEELKGDVSSLPLRKIRTNPDQPRKHFDEEALRELADSIRNQGVIQPIIVDEESAHGLHTIVAGERRFRAARLAGLSEIPVIIRAFSEEDKLEIALVENVQREDLNPVEEAQAYRHLMDAMNLSQDAVARKVGKKRSTVANSLRLLKLPEDVQDSLVKGELTAGHARAILSVLNPADQRILYGRILQHGLSVRETEDQASALNKGMRATEQKEEKTPANRAPELRSIEQKFLDALGTKVTIRGSLKKGKIEIAYYSMDDLERLFDIISNRDTLF